MQFSQLLNRFDHWLERPWPCRVVMMACGILYPLAFAPFGIWPLAFLSITCLLYVLTKKTALTPFKLGLYWGIGAFGVGASWVYVSIHEFGFVPAPGAALLTLVFVLFLSLYKGLFTYLCHKIISHSHLTLIIFIAPVCWLLGEYLQAVVFGGFPWLIAGYSQTDSPLAPLATWFGVYGISWFVVAISALLALFARPQIQKSALMICVGVFVSVIVFANVHHVNAPKKYSDLEGLDVALVQPNVAQEKKWDRKYFSSIIDILFNESESLWGADLLVWPEGAIPAYAHQVNDILQDLGRIGSENGTSLILGIPEYVPDTKRSYVSLMAFGEQPQSYHKQVLVPFGEYVPLEDWLRGAIKFLDLPMSGFTPATDSQKPMQFEKATVIPAICYEIVYPQIIRNLAVQSDEDKPQLIVTVSNDAWFGDSFGPYQHMQMARMRSLELGIPLVRSTNDGITAVVDIDGNIIKKLPRYFQGSLRSRISLENRQTLYRQYGLSSLIVLLLLSCSFIVWSIVSKRGKK